MRVILTALYFLALSAITIYGLLSCFWREQALKLSRIWTSLARMQAPDADWNHVDRTLVPPRPVGFFIFLAGLWMLYQSLVMVFGKASGPRPSTSPILVRSHNFDLTAAICFFAMSVYILADPIGFLCLFTFQKRSEFHKKGKRGWAVVAMALVFIIVSGYLLFIVFKH